MEGIFVMIDLVEIEYVQINNNKEYELIIRKVLKQCFEVEKIDRSSLYVNIILTTPDVIRKYNKKYRNIDMETDVLSFPMFEREELISFDTNVQEVLGDIVISVDRVEKQAKEYGHTFERELSYMVVHGFYHLMGYDHIEEQDKKHMREKEEYILDSINITR